MAFLQTVVVEHVCGHAVIFGIRHSRGIKIHISAGEEGAYKYIVCGISGIAAEYNKAMIRCNEDASEFQSPLIRCFVIQVCVFDVVF